MRKLIVCCLLILISVISFSQVNIIPKPVELIMGKGNFQLKKTTPILAYDKSSIESANIFNYYLKNYYGFTLPVKNKVARNENYIFFSAIHAESNTPAEGYGIKVTDKKIEISSRTTAGSFYGIQTLIQLLPIPNPKSKIQNISIPQLTITDYPRFQHRGLHLDCARHFFPISFVKKYIDFLALHKMNRFHWHLTDDQGWRIEIKKYPELTKIGAYRNGTIIGRYPGKGSDNKPYDGYYTQEQIKEVVAYAKERYIEVIPEIEMPGHASAAIAAYPWLSCFSGKPTNIPANMISKKSVEQQKNGRIKLVQETWGVFDDIFCAGNDSTFMFLQNVIDEVLPLFPSKYFHIGGDEAPKTHWKICPKCQKRIKDLGLKDEHELQSYLVQRMEKYLNSKGKTLIGWDEILEGGLAPNAVVMSWRGEQGGIDAAKLNHDVIMTPGNPVYFDHSQSENEDSVTIGGYNPIEKVCAWNPVPKILTDNESKHILGAQANLWTEYIDNTKKVEYMIFPRIAALSEVLWTPLEKKDSEDFFNNRLPQQLKRYDQWKINYSKAFYDLKATVLPNDNFRGVMWKIETKLKPSTIEYRDTSDSDDIGVSDYITYNNPFEITKSSVYEARLVINKKQLDNPVYQKFSFNKATGKQIKLITPASSSYPGDGAFTLVNGVQNEKGLVRSKEFLGFNGTDCEVLINLGSFTNIKKIKVHVLHQPGSWIWRPLNATFQTGVYEGNYDATAITDDFIKTSDNGNGVLEKEMNSAGQYVRIVIKNWGTIPDGNGGAGNKAWLFVDEVEIE